MRAITFLAFLEQLKVSLTPAQRVLVRVAFDDVAPASLEGDDRQLAVDLFGEIETIPPEARAVLALLKGARIGGTWLCALYLLYRSLTADLRGLAAGEMAFAPIVAPDMKTGGQARRYALGAAQSLPSIARLIESESADGFVIRREHDRRLVAIETLAASRGGSALRGRTMVAALMDESSFFRDPDSGVVNDAELYRAIAPRVLVGGKLCIISTAWMRSGLLWDLIGRNFGKPATAIACVAPTLLVRTDSRQLARIVEEERARDPQNAAREFDCEPFDGTASAFIDPAAVDAMVDHALFIGARA